MINVILYNDESVIRIAKRVVDFFSNCNDYRVSSDTIWLKGMYIKFAPREFVVNIFDSKIVSEDEIANCIKTVLLGEEVYVTDNFRFQKYINEVNKSTEINVKICGDCL